MLSIVPADSKLCRKCNTVKRDSEFYHPPSLRGLPRPACKACEMSRRKKWNDDNKERVSQWRKEWKNKHPNSIVNSGLKDNYGITLDQFRAILESQGGKCAICRSSDVKSKRYQRMCVDHGHRTGKVRGVLCHPCNRALGLLKDESDVLRRAADYLERHR